MPKQVEGFVFKRGRNSDYDSHPQWFNGETWLFTPEEFADMCPNGDVQVVRTTLRYHAIKRGANKVQTRKLPDGSFAFRAIWENPIALRMFVESINKEGSHE